MHHLDCARSQVLYANSDDGLWDVSVRARRRRRTLFEAPGAEPAEEPSLAPSSSTPTAIEHTQAVDAISKLQELKLLRGKAMAVEPNVIALALAWRCNDRALNGLNHQERNVLFGLPARAETHRDWVIDAASRRLDRLDAYRRHCSLPESEREATFDVATCLGTKQREPRPSRSDRAWQSSFHAPCMRHVLHFTPTVGVTGKLQLLCVLPAHIDGACMPCMCTWSTTANSHNLLSTAARQPSLVTDV